MVAVAVVVVLSLEHRSEGDEMQVGCQSVVVVRRGVSRHGSWKVGHVIVQCLVIDTPSLASRPMHSWYV